MAEIGLRTRMLVKDVMSSPAVTIAEDVAVDKTARLMRSERVGCIIVTSRDGNALGIITESDLVRRVLAKNIQPSKLSAREVMSTPLITVEPDEMLTETARRMSKLKVRRLGVMYKGKLVGIISTRDIVAVTPELLDNIQEKARIEIENHRDEEEEGIETGLLAGYCEQCGSWSDTLEELEGSYLCEECRMEL